MANGEPSDGNGVWGQGRRKKDDRRYNVLVALNDEQMAAAEGWRSAHGITNQAEALGELIRLGLLSEIAKIYRLVSDNRAPASARARSAGDNGRGKADPKPQSS